MFLKPFITNSILVEKHSIDEMFFLFFIFIKI